MTRLGLLTMAYGTASEPSEVAAYYTHIRHGHPPAQALIDELTQRYAQLPGGRSPLLEITTAQTQALAGAVRDRGLELAAVQLGQKHSAPFIEDAVQALVAAGVDRIIGIVFAPHWSTMSVAEYLGRARRAAAEMHPDVTLDLVDDWHLAPGYIDWLTDAVHDALAGIPEEDRDATEVIFTAHSLPVRILQAGDPYPTSLQETAAAVAEHAGLTRWSTGWQSAGQTATPWLGPDLLDLLPGKRDAGARGIVVCACGFVADHLEVLYDLDLETRQAADRLGLSFARTAMPNADPRFIDTLADIVIARAGRPAGPTAAAQAAADRHATHTGKPEHAGLPGARGTLTS
ncbi:MAG: ferrochelatase [Patulibacter sp.]